MQKFWKRKKVLFPIAVGILLSIAIFWYVNDYYHSDESVQVYLSGEGLVSIQPLFGMSNVCVLCLQTFGNTGRSEAPGYISNKEFVVRSPFLLCQSMGARMVF